MLKTGQGTDLFEMKVSEEDAKAFAKVLNDLPLSKTSSLQSIVPTTYPIIFWQMVDLPWLKNIGHLVHGEQTFHYRQPMLTDKSYFGEIKLIDVARKEGKSGVMIWLTHEMNGYMDQNREEKVFTAITKAMFMPEEEGED